MVVLEQALNFSRNKEVGEQEAKPVVWIYWQVTQMGTSLICGYLSVAMTTAKVSSISEDDVPQMSLLMDIKDLPVK